MFITNIKNDVDLIVKQIGIVVMRPILNVANVIEENAILNILHVNVPMEP